MRAEEWQIEVDGTVSTCIVEIADGERVETVKISREIAKEFGVNFGQVVDVERDVYTVIYAEVARSLRSKGFKRVSDGSES